MDRFVALKVLRQEFAASGEEMRRFMREAEALSRLTHPGVVTVYAFVPVSGGRSYFVMDFVDGSSLADLIASEAPFSPTRAISILIQVALAAHAAHEAGIIHRDLKPSNVMLTEQDGGGERAKILDFGIAKLLPAEGRSNATLTKLGEHPGTPLYMSPEQCRG